MVLLLCLAAPPVADAPAHVRKLARFLARSVEAGREPVPLPDHPGHPDYADYAVLIEPRPPEDGGYVATVPDLPGCSAVGETRELAARNVGAAIAAWIEEARALGREVPTPSRHLATARDWAGRRDLLRGHRQLG